MANTLIQLKKSSIPSAIPDTLANGEIAINYADGKLFYKDSSGSIQQISSGGNTFSTVNAAGTLLIADLPTDVLSIAAGDNIDITADILTDTLTISANLSNSDFSPAFDKANSAYDLANAALPKWSTSNLTFDQSITLTGPNLSNTAGERIVIWPQRPSGAYYNYSIGLEHDAIWFGVDTGLSSTGFKWYQGNTKIMELSRDANLTVTHINTSNVKFADDTIQSTAYQTIVFDTANAAFDKANAANLLAYGTGIGANAYAASVGIAANAYTDIVAIANTNVANAYARIFANAVGAAANAWANTKLSNTDGVTFAGSLNVTNTLYAYDLVLANSMIANISGDVYNMNVRHDLYIGNNITNVTSLIFNTSTNRTPVSPGELTWSQDDSTLHFDTDSPNNVILHIGQDLVYYVKNQSGQTIYKGNVCMFAGTLGASGRLKVQRAIANNAYPSKYVMGVAAANILDGNDGFVVSQGRVRGIDTSMFSQGDILYLSPTNPGQMQNTMPTAPNNKVTVAAVIYNDNNQGSIQVRPTFASDIGENENVELSGLTNGDLLVYNQTLDRFENKVQLSLNAGSVDGLTANTIIEAANGYARTYANSKVDTITSNSTSRIWANSVTVTEVETVYLDLSTSGVTACTYGNAITIPAVTVDTYGRITSASNTTLSTGGGANISITSTGTSSNLTLTAVATGATATNGISAITFDNYGRVTSVTGGAGYGTGTVTSVTGGSGLSGSISTTGSLSINVTSSSGQFVANANGLFSANSGVTPSVYGNAIVIPAITVDAYGSITAASNTTLSTGGGANIVISSTGTSSNLTLRSVATACTYGNAITIPAITIDAYGRVTSGSNTTLSTGGGANISISSTGSSSNLTLTAVTSACTATSGISAITVDAYGRVTSVTGTANYVVSGGALGTPSSGTLTNCTFPTLNQSTTGSAATLTTARTLTIGSTGKTFNGSADVSWSLTEIGALANTSGVVFTGDLNITGNIAVDTSTLFVDKNANYIGIGRTDPGYTFDVVGTVNASSLLVNGAALSSGITITNETTSSSTYYPIITDATSGTESTANVSSSKLYFVPSTGSLSATMFNSLSDIKYKGNVHSIVDATSILKQIDGVSFEWKENGIRSYGVIAQEIEKIIPEVVNTNNGDKTVNYDGIIAFLIQSVKELSREIEELKNGK